MKVVFLISGEVRPDDLKCKYNLEYIKSKLPDYVDVKCVTWDRGKKYDFIDKYYEEPVAHYWPKNSWDSVKLKVNRLRELKASGAEWPPVDNMDFEIVTQRFKKSTSNRYAWKHRNFQCLIHAYAVRDFAKDYDIVVRARYDNFYDEYDHIEKAIEVIKEDKTKVVEIASVYAFVNEGFISNDFEIIHHKDAFDYEYVIDLFKSKQLLGAESGWSQAFKVQINTTVESIRSKCGRQSGFNNIVDVWRRRQQANKELSETEEILYERYKEELEAQHRS